VVGRSSSLRPPVLSRCGEGELALQMSAVNEGRSIMAPFGSSRCQRAGAAWWTAYTCFFDEDESSRSTFSSANPARNRRDRYRSTVDPKLGLRPSALPVGNPTLFRFPSAPSPKAWTLESVPFGLVHGLRAWPGPAHAAFQYCLVISSGC
jgi:hypothetical protein